MNFENIHNYYESLVIQHAMKTHAKSDDYDEDGLEDIVCLALNNLPARYVRHDVDMAFFLTSQEREKMQHDVIEAVQGAAQTVKQRNRETEST